MNNIEEVIDIINKCICEAIIYSENNDELINVLNEWIVHVHLSDKYTAKTILVYANYPAVSQIVSI